VELINYTLRQIVEPRWVGEPPANERVTTNLGYNNKSAKTRNAKLLSN
jgi:hypothetical protein